MNELELIKEMLCYLSSRAIKAILRDLDSAIKYQWYNPELAPSNELRKLYLEIQTYYDLEYKEE